MLKGTGVLNTYSVLKVPIVRESLQISAVLWLKIEPGILDLAKKRREELKQQKGENSKEKPTTTNGLTVTQEQEVINQINALTVAQEDFDVGKDDETFSYGLGHMFKD